MARNRSRVIKPEFFDSPDIAALSFGARLLFIGMWCYADDCGCLLNSDRKLLGDVFPRDEKATEKLVTKWKNELIERKMVTVYEDYLIITNWFTHQKIDHPSKTRYNRDEIEDILNKTRETLAKNSRDAREKLAPKEKEKEKGKGKEKGKQKEEGKSASPRGDDAGKDFISLLVDDFSNVYEQYKGQPYLVTNEGKERSGMSTLLTAYKKKNPNADTDTCRAELKATWAQLVQGDYKTEFLRTITITKIASHLSEYMEVLRHERTGGNQQYKPKPGRGRIDETAYREFGNSNITIDDGEFPGGTIFPRSLSSREGTDHERNNGSVVQDGEESKLVAGDVQAGNQQGQG